MNNTFNIKRFGLLLRRQWLDSGNIYLISLVVLTAVLVGFYWFNLPTFYQGIPRMNNNGTLNMDFRYLVFAFVGFLFITIEASTYFASLGRKERAIVDLILPSSTFEKFLSGVFYTAILSTLSYIIIFYLVDLSFCKYMESISRNYNLDYNTTIEGQRTHFSTFKVNSITTEIDFEEFWGFVFVPMFLTSVFLLGSIYFKRFHYIKTAVSIVSCGWLICYIVYKITDWMTKNMINVKGDIIIGKDQIFPAIFIITMILTFAFWGITYIRLREKEA